MSSLTTHHIFVGYSFSSGRWDNWEAIGSCCIRSKRMYLLFSTNGPMICDSDHLWAPPWIGVAPFFFSFFFLRLNTLEHTIFVMLDYIFYSGFIRSVMWVRWNRSLFEIRFLILDEFTNLNRFIIWTFRGLQKSML